MAFDSLIFELHTDRYGRQEQRWLTVWKHVQLIRGGGDQPRFEAFWLDSQPIAIRVIQGQTATDVDPKAMGWTLVNALDYPRLYHGTKWSCWRKIHDKGIILGGRREKEKKPSFRLPAELMDGFMKRILLKNMRGTFSIATS